MAEFVLIAPVIFLLGLGIVQMGLVYHAKTVVNYATFEAARAGSVSHAQPAAMRKELGLRLAPLFGGDGGLDKAAVAIARSKAAAIDPMSTRIRIINPTTAAFDDWGEVDNEGGRAIPTAHLRHKHQQRQTIGVQSGLNLHDANLLKIEVTYAYPLKVPLVATVVTRALTVIDPTNAFFYSKRTLPIKSVATVRMQNDPWESALIASLAQPPLGSPTTADAAGEQVSSAAPDQTLGHAGDAGTGTSSCVDPFGLPAIDVMNLTDVSGNDQQCAVLSMPAQQSPGGQQSSLSNQGDCA